jgi:hypothetical protein
MRGRGEEDVGGTHEAVSSIWRRRAITAVHDWFGSCERSAFGVSGVEHAESSIVMSLQLGCASSDSVLICFLTGSLLFSLVLLPP